MPHSSGGGSHSGGSHGGGGSHNSGSSGSSSHNGSRFVRTSRRYFPGSRTFVYYRHSRPYYVYADSDIRRPPGSKIDTLVTVLIMMFLVLFICVPMLVSSGAFPIRLRNTESYKVYIDDRLNILGDTSKLLGTLERFKEKTGVTPAVITDRNSSWSRYASLENYAYDLYVNLFDDETHWLIVYTAPENPDQNFVDWHWEGMQGDNTDSVINTQITDIFTSSLQKYLSANSRYSVSEALSNAFEVINKNVMKPQFDMEAFAPLIVILIGFVLCFFILNNYYQWTKPYKPNELQEVLYFTRGHKPETYTCEYCGGTYVFGLSGDCPHCGKSIKSPH